MLDKTKINYNFINAYKNNDLDCIDSIENSVLQKIFRDLLCFKNFRMQIDDEESTRISKITEKSTIIAAPKDGVISNVTEDYKFEQIGNLQIEILDSIDSTNNYLLNKIKLGIMAPYVVLTKNQTHGRGRNGKTWLSSYDKSLCVSVYQKFNKSVQNLSGFSLVVGMAVTLAIRRFTFMGFYQHIVNNVVIFSKKNINTHSNYNAHVDVNINSNNNINNNQEKILFIVAKCLEQIKVKWPNDIYYSNKKLSGVLIETVSSKDNFIDVIIGIGCNIEYDENINESQEFNSTCVQQIFNDVFLELNKECFDNENITDFIAKCGAKMTAIDKNKFLSLVFQNLFNFANIFAEHGLNEFERLWEHLDFLQGKTIAVKAERDCIHFGVMSGINNWGGLMLTSNGVTKSFLNAEILDF